MVFSSLIFLFAFLPTVLLLYFSAPKSLKNGVLFAVSLFFYGWGEPRLVPLMLFAILSAYVFGLLIERFSNSPLAKVFLGLSVIISLGMLGYFKYVDFFIEIF